MKVRKSQLIFYTHETKIWRGGYVQSVDFHKLKNEGISLWSEQAESCHAICMKNAHMVGGDWLSGNKDLSKVEGMEGAQNANEASAAKNRGKSGPLA